ncbi:Elongation of very long chain fatty acids like protein [Argiope bruennichi]|uniref:Elongation of very long chain fatty acids protein n=1 Tax=Argiope bruennichi TaxID=94029 RepID=A0A8T0EVM3_ARGBR|nr:Elongation of very long chain fatty acids like protein [Argiope bruennichi]
MHSLQESVWWKGKSTRLQMIVALIIFATVILPLIGYRITQRGKFFEILAAIGFLALFYKFYMKTAIEKPLNKKEESLNSKTTSSERSGFQFVPGVTNSIVHIVMYTYYGLAAIGPEVQKHLWWKEYLTRMQILQFIVIILFVTVILPITGCTPTKHGIYIDIAFALIFLSLFINFYTKTYKKSLDKSGDSFASRLKSKTSKAQ